jgi:hypothetical protein
MEIAPLQNFGECEVDTLPNSWWRCCSWCQSRGEIPCRNIGEGIVDGAGIGGEAPRKKLTKALLNDAEVIGEAPH